MCANHLVTWSGFSPAPGPPARLATHSPAVSLDGLGGWDTRSLGSVGSNSFLKAGFHLAFVRSVSSVMTAWRRAEMPPTTPVPTQRELTALNFGEKILLSCRLDSLSEGRELFTAHARASSLGLSPHLLPTQHFSLIGDLSTSSSRAGAKIIDFGFTSWVPFLAAMYSLSFNSSFFFSLQSE